MQKHSVAALVIRFLGRSETAGADVSAACSLISEHTWQIRTFILYPGYLTVSKCGSVFGRSEHSELVEGRSRRLLRRAQDASTRLLAKVYGS